MCKERHLYHSSNLERNVFAFYWRNTINEEKGLYIQTLLSSYAVDKCDEMDFFPTVSLVIMVCRQTGIHFHFSFGL